MGDQRIYKQESRSYGSTVGQVEGAAWHLRDVQGRELGVLDLTEGTWEWYAFDAQRFARIRPAEELQPVFYDGDIGSDHRGQENDEYTSLAQCVAQLAGPGGRLEYPVTLVRVVLQDGTVLFLSEAAYAALDSVSSELVAEHDLLVFESDDDRITVLHNREEVTMSLREVLDGGREGGGIAVNGNGFWYTVPRFGRTSEVTYYEHDHLGDLRVAYVVDPVCAYQEGDGPGIGFTEYRLEHVLDYYPYGKVLRQYVNSNGPERYLTTQHERDQETGLDYGGARYYDSDVARFLSLDPKSVAYASWSPYNYVMGNPISLIDPDGKACDCPNPPCGEVVQRLQGLWDEIAAPLVDMSQSMQAGMASFGNWLDGLAGDGGYTMTSSKRDVPTNNADRKGDPSGQINVDYALDYMDASKMGPKQFSPELPSRGAETFVKGYNKGWKASQMLFDDGSSPPAGQGGSTSDVKVVRDYQVNRSGDTISVASPDGQWNGNRFAPGDTMEIRDLYYKDGNYTGERSTKKPGL